MSDPQGALLVCPTPIGNLEDVTLRVLRVLAEADVVACEDKRRTPLLLERHGIRARELVAYHEHNERQRTAQLVQRIQEGATVALVSDAGMPIVSDPGFLLVRECLAAGVQVEVLPGASSVPVALVASGLPAAQWCFVGFLPRKRGQRERVLADAAHTLVALESPKRLAATLDMLANVDADRPVAVCRELTKLHEEVRRGPAHELAAHYRTHAALGEVVLVVGAAAPTQRVRRPAAGADHRRPGAPASVVEHP